MRRKVVEQVVRRNEFARHGHEYLLECGHQQLAYPRWVNGVITHPKTINCHDCDEVAT